MSACLASTISEWIISFLTCIYVATFTPEFKYFELIKPKILFHELTRNNEVPGNENSETQSNGTVATATFTETSAKYWTHVIYNGSFILSNYMLNLLILNWYLIRNYTCNEYSGEGVTIVGLFSACFMNSYKDTTFLCHQKGNVIHKENAILQQTVIISCTKT